MLEAQGGCNHSQSFHDGRVVVSAMPSAAAVSGSWPSPPKTPLKDSVEVA